MSTIISTASANPIQTDPMSVGRLKIDTVLFQSVEEINPELWVSVVEHSNRFLCLDYLSALEESHDEGLELRYVLFMCGSEPVGAAAFQITHFTTSGDAYSNLLFKGINSITKFVRRRHIHNVLICGNAIATGEHGFSFHKGIGDKRISSLIVGAMQEIAKQEKKRGMKICAMIIKDFYPDSVGIADEMEKLRFKKFQVDHNMVMPLLKEWLTFDDYLESMNTKFRTKAKAALKRSSNLEIREWEADELTSILPQLEMLYDNVYQKADFRLGKLDVSALPLLLRHLSSNFTLKTYSINGEIIGFMTAMRCGDMLEAHIIGLDYEMNRDHAVYQRMLYDYIELGIQSGCRRIVFGRTAAEIKSSVGALPVDLSVCFLHQMWVSNALLSLILQYVKPSEYPHREPFKAEVMKQIIEQPLY